MEKKAMLIVIGLIFLIAVTLFAANYFGVLSGVLTLWFGLLAWSLTLAVLRKLDASI